MDGCSVLAGLRELLNAGVTPLPLLLLLLLDMSEVVAAEKCRSAVIICIFLYCFVCQYQSSDWL